MDELSEFIKSNSDSRELKRALAIQMLMQDYTYYEIRDVLSVSVGFITQWRQHYEQQGVRGLYLRHQGSRGDLTPQQRQAVLRWLQQKNNWNLGELQQHMEEHYDVVFESKQSYYSLFAEAGISWKKTQKRNPKADPQAVEKKQEITQGLERHRDEIVSGQLLVFFQDECHLLWGDLCGYVWGKTSERIEVPMTNERHKQTDYGALNLATQTFWLEGYEKGNSASTLAFLKRLQAQHPGCRIGVIWDGASHPRSEAVKDYLAVVNQNLDESMWKLSCIRFAPNDPQQNPVEEVWLQAKRFIREFYHLCKSFRAVKWLFEFVTHCQIFRFPKAFMYGSFSQII